MTIGLLILASCGRVSERISDAITGATQFAGMDGNSMYHQGDAVQLTRGSIDVVGEVKEPGNIRFRRQVKREVFTREARFRGGEQEFRGAYRYRGYSLFDLLHPFEYQKKNAEEFPPGTDLYIVVENDLGETVVFSWAEIFHTSNPHQVLIAVEMAPIEPYRAEVNYPADEVWKVVSAGDLFAERHLLNPVRIHVHSFHEKEYPIQRRMENMFSASVRVEMEGEPVMNMDKQDAKHLKPRVYQTAFWGMGMGYHKNPQFSGPYLHELLGDQLDLSDPALLRNGLVCFAAIDGYRAVFSFSQLFNRLDQSPPILAIPNEPGDGGHFRLFLPDAFFADYSVKSVSDMYVFLK